MSRRWKTLGLLAAAMLLGLVLFAGARWHRGRPERAFQDASAAIARSDIDGIARGIKILEGRPGFDQHVELLRGALFLRAGDAPAALRQFARLRPEGELREPILSLTGEALYWSGHLAKAEAVFGQLVREQPEHATARRWLGAIYYDLGAMEAAIEHLNEVARLEPDDYRPHRLLGLIYFDFEQYPESIEHYRLTLERQPPQNVRIEAVRYRADALIRQREYQAALGVLDLLDGSADAALLALESECLWSLGERDRAEAVLDQAKSLDPNQRSVLLLDARMRLDANRPESAIAPLQRVLEQDPHDYQSRYQLALTYQQLGRTDEHDDQIARMEESRELRQDLSDLNYQAIARPRDAEVRDRIADVCDRLGKRELAAMWRQAAEACRNAHSGVGTADAPFGATAPE